MPAEPNLLDVAVLFGGRSVEHEISIITALQIIENLDTTKYRALPVYISPDGRWYTGRPLLDRKLYKKQPIEAPGLQEVLLSNRPSELGFYRIDEGRGARLVQESIARRPVDFPASVFFPAFHGSYGEDGCVQGMLEMLDAPFVGSGVCASSVGMNKDMTKLVAKAAGIPVVESVVLDCTPRPLDLERLEESVRQAGLVQFPLFVKPCSLGSSIGIAKARSPEELRTAIVGAAALDSRVMVERCVEPLLEVNVAVLREGAQSRASVVEIPLSKTGMLTYEDKYATPGGTKSQSVSSGMASAVRAIDPSDLPSAVKEAARAAAVDIFDALGCAGVARVDFLLDTARDTLYFNEINTIPGSLGYYLFSASTPKLLFPDLLTVLIRGALERAAQRRALARRIEFKVL